jgi:hypothetical protein
MAVQMNYQSGISGCADDAVAPEFYRFNSRFDGIVNGQRVTVFAGSLRGDPLKGVLLVRALPADEGRRGGRHIGGPAGCGTLRLVGWTGTRLKTIASNGDAIWFDVPACALPEKAKSA